ncbi:SOUL family heme-binding protein [Afifella pfennigii]|uniref:SOUL family heme-binding protein n=1 Tax=Afifella pfennigii TaxID=209897 RepID=UPI0009FEF552|nr:heme-binding protein [Afifella pfennigii]
MANALSRSYAQIREELDELEDRLERAGRTLPQRLEGAVPWRRRSRHWYDTPAEWGRHGAETARDYALAGAGAARAGARAGADYARAGAHYVRERPTLAGLVAVGAALVLVGGAIYAARRTSLYVEEPDYDVVDKESEFELRDYGPMIVAETRAAGRREEAANAGFHRLADYIFARQRPGRKIAMTAPVMQLPVTGETGRRRGWRVRFVMPAKLGRAELPEPVQDEVKLEEMPARRVAAVTFSGNMTDRLALENLAALRMFIADRGLTAKAEPTYAYYNPPMIPGFLKRNEIMIEVEKD